MKKILSFLALLATSVATMAICYASAADATETTEEYPINFDKTANNNHASRYTSNISLQVTGGEKQVISVTLRKGYEDLTTGDDKFVVPAGSEVTPSFGYNGEWMHGYVYIDLDNDKQFSYNADGDDQTGTELVAFSYYDGKNSKGETAAASCNVYPPSFTAPTTPGTYRIRYKIDWDNVDPGGSTASGNHILNNGGGIWDATLVVEAVETPFTPVTTSYTSNASIKFGDNVYKFADAKVEVVEDPEGVYTVTYKDLIVNNSRIGDFSIDNVSATEAEGAVTLATTATEGKWVNVEADNIIGVSENDAVAIRNFNGTITTDEASGEAALTLGFGVNITGEWADVTFGVKEEEPKPECEYTDVVDHGFAPAGESWQKTGVAIDWDTQYIKAEIDLSTCTGGASNPENILGIGDDLTGWNNGPHYLFYYNAADKVLQYNYLNSDKKDLNSGYANLSKAYLNAEGVVTIELSKKHGLKINGESCLVKYVPTASSPSTNGTESWTEDDLENVFGNLWAMSEIGFGGCQGNTMSNATYNYIHVLPLPAEVVSENTYRNPLTLADNTTGEKYLDLEDAEAVVTRYSDNTVKLTFKDITLGDNTSDLSFTGTYAEAEPSEQADETEEFTPVLFTISDAKGDDAVKALFGDDVVLTANGKLLAEDNLYLAYTLTTADGDYKGEFGSIPTENITVAENYQADGTGFSFTEPIDWDKQKVVMSINVASCQRSVEHLFGVGIDGTSWQQNVHCYWTTGNQLQCYWDGNDGNGNNNTGKFDCNETVLVEISKADGLKVDNTTQIEASRMDGLYDMSTITIGSGESSNQESYALYNYIKIVDLNWQNPPTGINNAGAAADGTAQIYTISGVKVNSLQKGINIVRTADGKTTKVLVK